MVGYLPIADEEVQPGAPLLSSLGVRLRDNPIAIAEGWQDAPNVLRKRARLFTSSGTWEKPAQIRCVEVHVIGGGGGAGGATATTGRGGGGGGYAMKVIDRDDLGSSVPVTVGQGGQGGERTATASASDGQNGGTSSFGSHVSATGGGGGTAHSTGEPGAAGTGAGGDVMVRGYPGDGSAGGGSGGPYGTAWNTGYRNAPTSQTYGVGGNGVGETGGNGSRGMVLVIEYLGGEADQ